MCGYNCPPDCSSGYWHYGLHVVRRALNLNCIKFLKIPSWLLAVFQHDTVMTHGLFLYIDTAHTTWSFDSTNIWAAFGCGLLPISPTSILTKYFPVIRFLNRKVMNTFIIIILYLLWTLFLCYSCFLIYKLWNISFDLLSA